MTQEAILYATVLSHPSRAVMRMLDIKSFDYKVRNLVPGMTPLVRFVGFPGRTAPALRIDGRHLQPSLAISRELERLVPQPALFPVQPSARRAVEEAEQWNDSVLQDISRRIFIWGLAEQHQTRKWMLALAGVPAPALNSPISVPFARSALRQRGITEAQVRKDLRMAPSLIDHIEKLMREGVIGGEQPNVADLQIGASVRHFALFEQLWPAVRSRPAGQLAQRLFPDWPGPSPVKIPPQWLPAW